MFRKGICYMGVMLLLSAYSWALDFYQAKEGTVARENASADAPIIYRFKIGEEFRVLGKEGEWLQVRFSSKVTGYVKEAEAEVVASPPPASPVQASAQGPSSTPAPVALDQQTREAMERAIKPLRLLGAAMETGMNYQQYGTRIVDAKMETESALSDRGLHVPSDFASEIYAIFGIYQDARLAWEWKIRQGTFCDQTDCSYSRDDGFVSSLFSKYPFLHSTITQEAPGGIFLPNGIWAHSRALSLLWAEAKAKAEKLAATIPPASSAPPAPSQTAEERLRNLKDLLDKKLITPVEYKQKRSEILKGM